MGFNITASDIEIHVSPTELDNVKTRIDTPGSVYGVYEKNSDKIRVHVLDYCWSKICSIIVVGLSDVDTNAVIHK